MIQNRAYGSIFRPKSCRKAGIDIREDREKERTTPVSLYGATESDRIVVSRRDVRTGLVLGTGFYQSLDNPLTYAPPADGGTATVPHVRLVPLEFLAHSKLSPSIDVGAGIGVAFLHTAANNGRPTTNTASFYYVPLSVVIRPAAMFFPDNRYAAGFGFRINARRFGSVSASDFGAVPGSFSEKGEFLWGHSIFFDLVSLLDR
jgi:hypothetical protein